MEKRFGNMGFVAVSLRSAIQPTTHNAMTHTKHDFTERTTSDLKFTLSFVQELLASAKEAISKEPDPVQHAAYAERIADYKAGIAAIQEELQTR